MRITINHKLSSERIARHKELCAIEATIAACHPGFIVHESWGVDGGIIYELRKEGGRAMIGISKAEYEAIQENVNLTAQTDSKVYKAIQSKDHRTARRRIVSLIKDQYQNRFDHMELDSYAGSAMHYLLNYWSL